MTVSSSRISRPQTQELLILAFRGFCFFDFVFF